MLITCEPVDILRCWHWFRLVDVDIGSDWLILTLHWFRLGDVEIDGTCEPVDQYGHFEIKNAIK